MPALVQRPRPAQARARGHPDPLVEANAAAAAGALGGRVRFRGCRGGRGGGRVVEHCPVRRPATNAGVTSVGCPASNKIGVNHLAHP